jgi:tryptophan halogenase
MNADVRRVVIAGGGTAGWIAAAALGQQLHGLVDIVLVESDEIGTVGVGESTIPPIRTFHRIIQVDEQQFMRSAAATFKLGISFEGWRNGADRYIHAFGMLGKSPWACQFHHFWLESLRRGLKSKIGEYCLEFKAACEERFATSPQARLNYAYHLDASVYAKFLRKFSERFGVKRIEGKIKSIEQHPESGFVRALVLESGERIEGDLFVDCTGFRGLLIEQTLHTGYEDWGHWLLCDRAVALQTELVGPAVPYTRAIAHRAGWRWRIPLQHRMGNGLVYCSRHMSDDEATQTLHTSVDGQALNTPRVIRFQPGRRRQVWNKNVVALGLASGFIEPLESTSIHLIITGVTRLVRMFPFGGIVQSLVDRYNAEARREIEHIRDFIILHYHVTERDDSEFWRECRTMKVPESLALRIDAFRDRAHVWQDDHELFAVDSWVQVMLGQGILPRHHHYLPKVMSDQDLRRLLSGIKEELAREVEQMPRHHEFVNRYCRAGDATDARQDVSTVL